MTDYKMDFSAQVGFSSSLDIQVTTVEQFLDQEPFSPEIREWFRNHTEVRDALKIIIHDRFVPTHAISVVDNPDLEGVKQSIGIYSIDTAQNNQIKQDYLMHETDDTYVLFTGIPKRIKPSQYVQHVNTLVKRYGPGGQSFYNDHHRDIDDIPPAIRSYIEIALQKARKRQS